MWSEKLGYEVLAWLSVWNEVQVVSIWNDCCHRKTTSCLVSVKSQAILPAFWRQPTRVVMEKKPLNECLLLVLVLSIRHTAASCTVYIALVF